jgi:hypothetical protein
VRGKVLVMVADTPEALVEVRTGQLERAARVVVSDHLFKPRLQLIQIGRLG